MRVVKVASYITLREFLAVYMDANLFARNIAIAFAVNFDR